MRKADLCVACNKAPRLSVLSRCKSCFTQWVERDRKAREAKRLAAKKAKGHAHTHLYPAKRQRLCGAKTRKGTPCKPAAMLNGRCPNHGGLSTGPKTKAGRRRVTAGAKQWHAQRRAAKESGLGA